jgi:Protein of unknown function (DUF3572)
MTPEKTALTDSTLLLLQALAWICSEDGRAERLLSLTGLTATDLRERALDPAVLGAVGDFLMAHEPDLIACATALDVNPATLAGATA